MLEIMFFHCCCIFSIICCIFWHILTDSALVHQVTIEDLKQMKVKLTAWALCCEYLNNSWKHQFFWHTLEEDQKWSEPWALVLNLKEKYQAVAEILSKLLFSVALPRCKWSWSLFLSSGQVRCKYVEICPYLLFGDLGIRFVLWEAIDFHVEV